MRKGCWTGLITALLLLLGNGTLARAAQDGASTSGAGTPKADTSPILRQFPINLVPLGSGQIKVEQTPLPDNRYCLTIIGRMYLWWQVQDKNGLTRHFELQADNVVLFLSKHGVKDVLLGGKINNAGQVLGSDVVQAIYLSGDVVVGEGARSIHCQELVLDVHHRRALAVQAELRSFDVRRNIPVYVRAKQLLAVMEDRFVADNAVLTTSELHTPQISFSAARIAIVDNTSVDSMTGTSTDQSFTADMKDVRLNWYQHPLLGWSHMETDLQQPDMPLKGIKVGSDSLWGPTLETRWHLARVLGLQEEKNTDSTLMLDYYGKRGPAAGMEVNYDTDNYFGRIEGYVIKDWGQDRLGRNRMNLEPPDDVRGRFKVQHRQFLPDAWQVSLEMSYLSDKNYLEQFNRNEFNTDKEQETLLHIKRIVGNQGLSFLSKVRLNDHQNQVEELPTARFNWTGQSLFNNALTFYSNTYGGMLRYRYADGTTPVYSDNRFGVFQTRNELDLPLNWGKSKWVPYIAGTLGVDDGPGFMSDVSGRTIASQKDVLIGEAGLRVSTLPYWRVYPEATSSALDIDGIRHVVQPSLTLVGYSCNQSAGRQRNAAILGFRQRWQTKRGPAQHRRVVDWLRWNTELVWLSNRAEQDTTSQLTWNDPMNRLFNMTTDMSTSQFPPLDRRSSGLVGPIHNYVYSDMALLLTDSTAVVADGLYDMVDGVVRQLNVGISHVRWPDLSYYIGSRYLPDVKNGYGQVGSNALTLAATYRLDPRYAVVVSQQFDTDYGQSIRSEVSLLRKYYRLNYGLTFSVDESLHSSSIVFGLWPEGVSELGLGLSRYMNVGF